MSLFPGCFDLFTLVLGTALVPVASPSENLQRYSKNVTYSVSTAPRSHEVEFLLQINRIVRRPPIQISYYIVFFHIFYSYGFTNLELIFPKDKDFISEKNFGITSFERSKIYKNPQNMICIV